MVDPGAGALQEAHADGLAVVTGDATRQDVLLRAGVRDASQVIITTNRDDSSVLATLTVRQLSPEVWIVAAARRQENVALMRRRGELGHHLLRRRRTVCSVCPRSPTLGQVEDLLTYGGGLEGRRAGAARQRGRRPPQSLPDQVIAVVRDE